MNFTVYKSSAGSGKTYTLVKEYLKIILRQPTDFRSILAVTFTNKAAKEMKDRVISNLRILGAENPDQSHNVIKYLLPDLMKETYLSEDIIKENAQRSLLLILHNYSDFAISTIDSFVHKIIKTFAYDLKLSFNFEVELDAEKLLKQAIDVLINRVGIDPNLTHLLSNYVELKADDEKSWHIENNLLELAKTLTDERSRKYVSELSKLDLEDFKIIAKEIKSFIQQFRKSIKDIAGEAIILMDQNQIPYDAFFYAKTGIGQYFNKLQDLKNKDFEPNSRVLKTIQEDHWYSDKTEASIKHKIDASREDFKRIYLEIQLYLSEHLETFSLYQLLYKQIYPIGVLAEIENILNEIKSQQNIIHISEFNQRISEVVFSEPVPFIYERIGERYKHFLIDEFQDTSLLQWQNLIPLIENSLAEGHFNMIVGDGKQAIYRWRNGEVEQFSRLPEIYKKNSLPFSDEKEKSLKRNYKEQYLDRNFRSKMEIIEFNNEFFSYVSEFIDDPYRDIYKNCRQEFDVSNTGGYVQLNFIPKNENEDDSMLIRLKQIIDDLLNSGRDKNDIAILCRTKAEGKKCAQLLMENNIEVLSSESLLLSSSREINLIVSFLKYLINPQKKLNPSSIIQYMIDKKLIQEKNLSEVFAYLKLGNASDLGSKFGSYMKETGYDFHVNKLLSLPLYDLIEEIVRLFHLDENIDAYIQFFMDAALSYSLKKNSNLMDFLDWWEDESAKESIVVPEGVDAIQILTIHKSKGLEFPVVIYPYATANNIKNGLDRFWSHYENEHLEKLRVLNLPLTNKIEETEYRDIYKIEKQKKLLDLINLIYVAFTRSAEQLYVLTPSPGSPDRESKDVSTLLASFLIQKKLWKEDEFLYEFGEFIPVQGEKKLPNQRVQLKKLYSENWRNNIKISTSAPEVWEVEHPDKNIEKGKLIHYILSQILTELDIEQTVNACVESGILETEKKSEIIQYLEDIVNHPELKSYFAPGLKVKNEADILLDSGKSIRPDRLVFFDNETIVIDYKTGKPQESHELQINNYARIIHQMGYQNVRKILIYLSASIRVVQV